jgi:uncharacterized protein
LQNNLLHAIETNWVSLLVSIVIIGFLYYIARKHVKFGTRVLLALGLGLVVGIIFNITKVDATSIRTIGTIYVNLIKMLVMPLLQFSSLKASHPFPVWDIFVRLELKRFLYF